jgi:regulatory protein
MESTHVITALKAQKRNPERISVYLDGVYAFGLARIVAAWLSVGQGLSTEKIDQLRQQDAFEKAYQAALHLLSYRPRSAAEIRHKLAEKGFGEAESAAALTRLEQAGLVGDQAFAAVWAENRQTLHPRSRRMLKAELRQKGVAEEHIELALSSVPEDEQLAYEAALRSLRKWQGLDWQTFRQRLSGFLARKGFSYEVVAGVVRKLWEEEIQAPAHPEER